MKKPDSEPAYRLDPAYSVIRKFDTDKRRGTFVLAERLGLTRSAVTKWTLPGTQGGTGGYIPPPYYYDILVFAEERGITLNLRDFVKEPPLDVAPEDRASA